MKLLRCNKCGHIFNLTTEKKRTCSCGESSGKYYEDGLHAVYSGDCIPLGFSNHTLSMALSSQPDEGWGKNFEAFVIPKVCKTFTKIKYVR